MDLPCKSLLSRGHWSLCLLVIVVCWCARPVEGAEEVSPQDDGGTEGITNGTRKMVAGLPTGTGEVEESGNPGDTSKSASGGGGNAEAAPAPPTFTKKDTMHRIVNKPAGNTLRLKCPATGNPAPNITWFKDGVSNFTRHLGLVRYHGWGMAMDDIVVNDSGYYTCRICNFLGCIEFSSKVDVKERFPHRPLIQDGLHNISELVNASVVFECLVLSELEPHLEWRRGLVVEGDDETKFELIRQDGQSAEYLTLTNITHDDEGWYTCIASNGLGNTTASAYLAVLDEFPPDPVVTLAASDSFNERLLWGLCIAFVFTVLFVGCVITVFRTKLRREKQEKNQAMEIARAAIVSVWTKKVIIEKQEQSEMGNELMMPIVKIEKQMCKNKKASDVSSMSEYELPLDSDWEFPRDKLSIGKILGEGAFGKVVRAEADGIVQLGVSTTVAIKMLKEGHTDAEMMDLISEMEVMKMIGKHVNIINLLGCCTQHGPLYVIVEFAPHGNLRDFLRSRRPSSGSGYEPAIGSGQQAYLTQKDLVCFAYQVARGMEYLASRCCIHRDLAARNVLVSEHYVLKIADFGLARDIHNHDYYRKTTDGRLPVKWMAPEALFHRLYTSQSDVWSYGVLLWEIMTLGGTPYPSVPSVEKLFQLLRSGHRMEKPPYCSLEIYLLMRDCWSYQPSERPHFSEIVQEIDKILTVTTNEEYLDLGLPQLDTPPSSDESLDKVQYPCLI
nr:PREDICTED: fibroblast growth factor receptor homolog 1-like isoform X2 [Bemisia tabaci]